MWLFILAVLAALGVGYFFGKQQQKDTGVQLSVPKTPFEHNARTVDGLGAVSTSVVTRDDDRVPANVMKALDRKSDHQKQAGHAVKKGSNLIVVNKNLPVTASKNADGSWKITWEDQRSWLANMRVLHTETLSVKFVGIPNIIPEDEDERDSLELALEAEGCVPVFLEKDIYRRFYKVFCKQILWPLLHYVTPLSRADFGKTFEGGWQAYIAANMQFAKVVCNVCEDSTDYVWVHNYHLFVLPSLIRKKMKRAKIGMFIHTPFPSTDVFRVLPCRENILRGIMSADLVGFHTYDFARHFLSGCKRLMDLDFQNMPGGTIGIKYSGRDVSILISHVGIDGRYFQECASSKKVVTLTKQLRIEHKASQRKLVLGIDDLDVVKASFLKLQAFTEFLETHPEWVGKIKFVQVILTSSSSTQEDKKLVHQALFEEIKLMKDKFGADVIEVIERSSLELEEYIALNRASDLCIVSLFYDGLNLAPFEYTASQDADRPGALILSEFMGCTRSLSGVLRVNPWSTTSVIRAMEEALTYTVDQRKALHQRRFEYVQQHNLTTWAVNFMRHLEEAARQSDDLDFVQVGWGVNLRMVGLRTNFTHLDEFVLESAFTSASRKVMVFDYDGTLVKTKDTSSRLANEGPGPELKAKLKTLSEDAGTIVFIVSGRSRSQLQQWFHDVPELGLAAEKGCFLRWPAKIMAVARESVDDALQRRPRSQSLISKMSDQDSQRFSECEDLWDTLVPVADFSWKKVAMEIIESYTTHTDGSWIEDKELAIVWHYDSADRDYGRMQAAELAKYLDEVIDDPLVEIDISDQNYVLEIKPCNISKGSTVSYILERTRMLPVDAIPSDAKAPLPFVLCVGDDRSDEEMFMALDESVARLSQNATDSKAKISGSIKHQKKNVSRRRVGQVKGKEFKSNSERAQICKPSASTFTCCVGIKPSNARFYVYDEADLLEVITTLAELSVSKQTESQNIAIANKKTN